MEETEGIRADSPTVRKGNIKTLLLIAAKEGWKITTSDVTAAFLQSVPITRDVFVRPPIERRIPGMIWRLKRTAYGLVDASRGFHLSFSQKLADLGCVKSFLDPAMFIRFDKKTKKDDYTKVPVGIAVTHVDDVLHSGKKKFDEDVILPLKESFKFGSVEDTEFRYIGLNMKQTPKGIEVDQNHYVTSLEEPDMDLVKTLKSGDLLDGVGQSEFRSAVARLATVAYTSRPDLCFEVKALSTKYGKATKSDLRSVKRRMMIVKDEENSSMKYPDLGDFEDWILIGFCDAGIKSMPDKISSVSGLVTILCNRVTKAAAVLNWRSKKIKRKVTSSLAGECFAMVGIIGELVYTRAVLSEIYGQRINEVATLVVTDSRNLFEAVHSSKLVEDLWLATDIASIKEALEGKEITDVKWVPGDRMIANCLTKAGASGEELLTILRTGEYDVPTEWIEDLKINPRLV